MIIDIISSRCGNFEDFEVVQNITDGDILTERAMCAVEKEQGRDRFSEMCNKYIEGFTKHYTEKETEDFIISLLNDFSISLTTDKLYKLNIDGIIENENKPKITQKQLNCIKYIYAREYVEGREKARRNIIEILKAYIGRTPDFEEG